MSRSLKLLNVLQIVVCLTLLYTFFKTIPWLDADPISSIANFPEMAMKYPPPTWAKSFSINHGKPTYYPDYHTEKQQKQSIIITLLISQCLFIVISGIYSFKTPKSTSLKVDS